MSHERAVYFMGGIRCTAASINYEINCDNRGEMDGPPALFPSFTNVGNCQIDKYYVEQN